MAMLTMRCHPAARGMSGSGTGRSLSLVALVARRGSCDREQRAEDRRWRWPVSWCRYPGCRSRTKRSPAARLGMEPRLQRRSRSSSSAIRLRPGRLEQATIPHPALSRMLPASRRSWCPWMGDLGCRQGASARLRILQTDFAILVRIRHVADWVAFRDMACRERWLNSEYASRTYNRYSVTIGPSRHPCSARAPCTTGPGNMPLLG
jgi:hypothetical protein